MDVLKWVGVALAAGFVGYFGRYLAMQIIEKMHKKKSQPSPIPKPPPAEEATLSQDIILEQNKLKVEKKKAKTAAKKAKKEQGD